MEFTVGNHRNKSIHYTKKTIEWLKEEFGNNYDKEGYISEPKTINIVINSAFEHKNKCPTCYTKQVEIVDVHGNTHIRLLKPTHQQILVIILGLSMHYFIEIEYRYHKEMI